MLVAKGLRIDNYVRVIVGIVKQNDDLIGRVKDNEVMENDIDVDVDSNDVAIENNVEVDEIIEIVLGVEKDEHNLKIVVINVAESEPRDEVVDEIVVGKSDDDLTGDANDNMDEESEID